MTGFDISINEMGRRVYDSVGHLTGTGLHRVSALVAAVRYAVGKDVPGDFVECGVWRGGSVMAMALTLLEIGAERGIWLYDTFEGLVAPQAVDGERALRRWGETGEREWCYCPIEEVLSNVQSTGYRPFHLVKGRVEDTIPGSVPERIALLRLDTDWYSSTRHELIHLFPLLSPGGVLLVDDYGHWPGARKAVDDYLAEHGINLTLERVDKSARIAIK